MRNKKGYIGAIGDDLPSLIPIFLGLMIFFSVFLNTYNVYKNGTSKYSLYNEAISISAIMKEEPLISDYNQFKKTCNKINTTVHWNAFLVDLNINTDNQKVLDKSTIDEDVILNENSEPFQCKPLDDFKNLSDYKNTIIYMFPITLQIQDHAIPVKLYVTVWR